MSEEDFYKQKFFDELNARFDRIDNSQTDLANEVAEIKAKLSWIFGAAAAITFGINLLWQFLKEKFWK